MTLYMFPQVPLLLCQNQCLSKIVIQGSACIHVDCPKPDILVEGLYFALALQVVQSVMRRFTPKGCTITQIRKNVGKYREICKSCPASYVDCAFFAPALFICWAHAPPQCSFVP